jgi:hypothetical protein
MQSLLNERVNKTDEQPQYVAFCVKIRIHRRRFAVRVVPEWATERKVVAATRTVRS